MFTIRTYIGKNITPFVGLIASWRIRFFREFPYLYIGNKEIEDEYVDSYINNPRSSLVVIYHKDAVVGFSTGIPFDGAFKILTEIRESLLKKNMLVNQYYYMGEVIVLPEYRSRGLTSIMCGEHEKLAKSWGYTQLCMMTVIRGPSHPLKPKHYVAHDEMWQHLGFCKSNFTMSYKWPTLQENGDIENVDNDMMLWTKDINNKMGAKKV